jgi:hypothetical protein
MVYVVNAKIALGAGRRDWRELRRGALMMTKDLLLKCYEAALMPRWGEYARPVELDELGRQGQMLQTAFVIAECRRHAGVEISWERLIELTFIRFFRRLALTDIQAPVFTRLYGEHQERARTPTFSARWVSSSRVSRAASLREVHDVPQR